MRTEQDWANILRVCQVADSTVKIWAPVFAQNTDDDTFRSEEDMTAFLGQVLHESSMLTHLEENLNYSAERLMAVWPKRFPDSATASMYAHNPAALANKVYGGRMGNVNAGDGFKYRGRGALQVTGYDNYKKLSDVTCLDLVNNPDLLAQPKYALLSALAWWKTNISGDILGDPEAITRKVNGGLVGLADRTRLTDLAEGAVA